MIVAHVSDLHLGKKSPGDANGSQRLQTLRRAIATLAAHKADVLLIAGDTFDSPKLDQAIIEEAARSLALAKTDQGTDIPVVLIPGNHDPVEAGRLWTTFRKALKSAVHLVLEPELIAIGKEMFIEAYPCPTQFSPAPPWEKRLQRPARSAICGVLAHGTLQVGPVPEDEGDAYPFTQAEVESLGADYVALGHFHGVYPPWNGDGEIERSICYSGTHEPDQDGGDAGYAILAEVNKGQPTRLRRMKIRKRGLRLVEIPRPADHAAIGKLKTEITTDQPARFE